MVRSGDSMPCAQFELGLLSLTVWLATTLLKPSTSNESRIAVWLNQGNFAPLKALKSRQFFQPQFQLLIQTYGVIFP